jgi:hypothetical protein
MGTFTDNEPVRYHGAYGLIIVGSDGLVGENGGIVIGGAPLGAGAVVNAELQSYGLAVGNSVGAFGVAGSPAVDVMRFNGTVVAPTALASLDTIGSFQSRGFDGTAFGVGALIRIVASEAAGWAVGAHGSRIDFRVVLNGGTALNTAWIIDNTSFLLAGADNVYDIGATGATRPRRIYLGTAVQIETNGAASVTSGLCLTNQVSGAAGNVGTLGNAPAVGNPTFWIPVNINGALKYVPAW